MEDIKTEVTTDAGTPASKVEEYLRKNKEYLENNALKGNPHTPPEQQYRHTDNVEEYLRERKDYLKKHVPEGDPEKREVANMSLSQQYRRQQHSQNAGRGK